MVALAATLTMLSRRGREGRVVERERAVRSTAQHSLVVGLGDTGAAVARFLRARGERVCVIDSRAAPPGLAGLRAACPDVEVAVETLDERWLDGAGRVLLSPGLPYDLPLAV
jgi:UDP-N-acetylmuramoylalanine--D-glutamate ligase